MNSYREIDYSETLYLLETGKSLLIDVRENWEYEEFNIGGLNLPLNDLNDHVFELITYENLILACTNGSRSTVAAKFLCRNNALADKNIYHLHEGILGIQY